EDVAQVEGTAFEVAVGRGPGQAVGNRFLQFRAMIEERPDRHQRPLKETVAAVPVAAAVEFDPAVDDIAQGVVDEGVKGLPVERRATLRRLLCAKGPASHGQNAGSDGVAPLELCHTSLLWNFSGIERRSALSTIATADDGHDFPSPLERHDSRMPLVPFREL